MKNRQDTNRRNITALERNTIYFKIIGILLASISINFLSEYYESLLLINICLGIYFVFSLVMVMSFDQPCISKLFQASLFTDAIFVSILIYIRGGIRSDFYIVYFLPLIYSLSKKHKRLIISLSSVSIIGYYIACRTGSESGAFSFGRYLIRMLIMMLITYLLYTISKEMRITEEDRKKAYQMALIDPLTNVFSRNMLNYISSHRKDMPSQICIAIIDIDDFKALNDKLGHPAGDKILKLLAGSIKDNIGENDFCIRYGGDEFIILYIDNADINMATENIERIKAAFTNSLNLSMRSVHCTFSTGFSMCPPDLSIGDGIYVADKALYNEKKEKKEKIKTVS